MLTQPRLMPAALLLLPALAAAQAHEQASPLDPAQPVPALSYTPLLHGSPASDDGKTPAQRWIAANQALMPLPKGGRATAAPATHPASAAPQRHKHDHDNNHDNSHDNSHDHSHDHNQGHSHGHSQGHSQEHNHDRHGGHNDAQEK